MHQQSSTSRTTAAASIALKMVSCLALSALSFSLSMGAQATVIDFESQAINTSISNQYQALGVTFSSPGNPTEPRVIDFSGNSTTGQVLADFSVVGGIQLDAFFLSAVTSVSVIAYANPSYAVTAMAYDSSNNFLGSASVSSANFNHGVLSLSGLGAISKVSWTTGSDIAAVGIDNLTFPTVSVPLPGTLGLMLLPVIALGLKRRANARTNHLV
jgi:hypothetical protein